ncbi:CRISPR-associated endonuclease Cas1 [bacterium]|nr:CRISPR-associated endonuclease Cas1 [bacterium]
MSDNVDAPALVPVRMVNEFVYCPRLFYLEWVQGEWAENFFTEHGRTVHRRADAPTGGPPAPEEPRDFVCRSVAVSSSRLGLSTRVDVLEGEGGSVIPVEYKRGAPPDVPARAWPPERVQVCAQALILRDNGYRVERGEIYFAETKERVPVLIDDALVRETEAAVQALRATAENGVIPPPLVDSPKCAGCSLAPICLPDEVNLLKRSEDAEAHGLRQLHPRRDDKLPLYVQRGGQKIGVSGEVLEVRDKGTRVAEARLEMTSQVAIFGGVQVSTQALHRMMEREIPLLLFTAGGWFHGWAHGLGSKNVELRRAQYRAAEDPVASLGLARRIVSTKIANQRTILRRNHPDPGPILARLNDLAKSAETAESTASLLGLEGTAARLYFGGFPALLKADFGEFSFDGRNRRPPRDPVNALLSFVYALLTKDWTITCAAAGLDPFLGFFHRPRYGRPALALDLMEEFRSIVGDSIVLSVVNNGSIGADDFYRSGVGVALKDAARGRLIATYERRRARRLSGLQDALR